MNRSAVLHIPLSQYAYGVDESTIVIRLRTASGDMTGVSIYYGDRACRQTPVIFTKQEMVRRFHTLDYDYYEAIIHNAYKRTCYYFALDDGKEQWLYYGDRFEKEPVDDRSEYFQLPFNHRADLVRPPQWAQDAIIYNIFPDSFATGKNRISLEATECPWGTEITRGMLGGTIRGITENVEYLEQLGINAIYINPIFAAGEYHKYDLLDYKHIDPCFGTDEDFAELVETYHNHGIRVIIDGVFNHCGWKFFAFDDVVKHQEQSKYVDWFYGLQFPVVRPEDPEAYPNYECFGYERLMPKLNMENPETKEYFCDVGRYWVEKYGIDGWRLDVASEVNDDFWRSFARGVKEINPEAILIGEVWESAGHWLDGTMFDSSMNYDFRRHCKRFFAEQSEDAAQFHQRVVDMLMRYRYQTVLAQLNILDSHDVSRFLSVCHEDLDCYRLALTFQMTFPGMPTIFYGDECGICGVLEKDYRKPMPWDVHHELYDYMQELIRLRKSSDALRRGTFEEVEAEAGSRVYKYARCYGNEKMIVILNMEDTSVELSPEELQGTLRFARGLDGCTLLAKGAVIVEK